MGFIRCTCAFLYNFLTINISYLSILIYADRCLFKFNPHSVMTVSRTIVFPIASFFLFPINKYFNSYCVTRKLSIKS